MEAMQTPKGIIYNAAIVPALVLDLDGTVRFSKSGEFISGPKDLALYSDVEAKLWKFRTDGFLIVGVSNQGGVAFGHKTPETVMAEVDATLDAFESNPFHIIKCCLHHPDGSVFPYNHRSLLRKPDTGMLALVEVECFDEGYVIDWDKSLFVGDREEDRECASLARIPFSWAWEFFERSRPAETEAA